MNITIVGPNLHDQTKGDFHVHAAGCADLKRGQYRHLSSDTFWDETHDSVRSIVESVYGPEAGSFYEERWGDEEIPADAWTHYEGEFWFAPCTAELPREGPNENVETPA